tara:strand:- start:42 stop:200 length:159 start_codon:yes stop_codon:yes gene_type:complete
MGNGETKFKHVQNKNFIEKYKKNRVTNGITNEVVNEVANEVANKDICACVDE